MKLLIFLVIYSILMCIAYAITQYYIWYKYNNSSKNIDFNAFCNCEGVVVLKILVVTLAPLGLYIIINLIILEYIKNKINNHYFKKD